MTDRQARRLLKLVERCCVTLERAQHVARDCGQGTVADRLGEAKDRAMVAWKLAEQLKGMTP